MDVGLKIPTLDTDAGQVKVGGRRIVSDVEGSPGESVGQDERRCFAIDNLNGVTLLSEHYALEALGCLFQRLLEYRLQRLMI